MTTLLCTDSMMLYIDGVTVCFARVWHRIVSCAAAARAALMMAKVIDANLTQVALVALGVYSLWNIVSAVQGFITLRKKK